MAAALWHSLKKRCQLFIRVHNVAFAIVAVWVSNEDSSAVEINRCDTAQSPTGLTQRISEHFPVAHFDRIVPFLLDSIIVSPFTHFELARLSKLFRDVENERPARLSRLPGCNEFNANGKGGSRANDPTH